MPISIGIPFYNSELYLADAIRSVFAQTYQDWELILVDDGSTDRSLEIAYAVKDTRVRVLSDGTNKKLPYRLNQITAEARYNLVGRMDADDLISPFRFERQAEILARNSKYDLVTAGICSISNANQPIGVRCGSSKNIISGSKLLLGQCAVVHAAILGRRSWFQRNPYNETCIRTEDYELWLRTYAKNDFNIFIINEPLYYYREEENTTTSRILTAYAGQRNLYRKYGHLGFNPMGIRRLIATSYAKSVVVSILSLIQRRDLLLKRRNNKIDDSRSMEMFEREINQIRDTKVPGLD
jgi:glycosyltransferase involved in cell wall biosynthesis